MSCLAFARAVPAYSQTVGYKPDIVNATPTIESSSSGESALILPGIVVETVEKNSWREKDGMQVGDVLLGWSRGQSHGQINSPIDFSWLQMDQVPRGPVKVYGTRRGIRHFWECDGIRMVETRLNFAPLLLAKYEEVKTLIRAGKTDEAYSLWYDAAGSLSSVAQSLSFLRLAQAFNAASQWEQAEAAYDQALRSAGEDQQLQLFIYRDRSRSYWNRQDFVKAAEFCKAALQRVNPAAKSLVGASLLTQCAGIIYYAGDIDSAEQYALSAVAIYKELSPGTWADMPLLLSLGNIAFYRGDLAKSENYYRRGLARKPVSGSLFVSACLIGGLGLVAYNRGDWNAAERYYRQALFIFAKHFPSYYEFRARSYENLALVAERRGDLQQAEKYIYKAWQIEAPHKTDLFFLTAVSRLGNLRKEQGDLQQAEKYLKQVLAERIKRVPGSLDLAAVFSDLGDVALESNDLPHAEEYFREALKIREKLSPGSVDSVNTLASLAIISLKQHRVDEAAPLFERALSALESQSARLGGSSDVRSTFRAKHSSVYRDYSTLLISQNEKDLAFNVLERSRARSLLEMLATAHINVQAGAEPGLIEREHRLQADLNAKSDRRIRLMGETHDEKQLKEVEKEIADLLAQYQDIESQIRATSPAYAALTQPQPLTAKEVQSQLLDENTLLLEYSLGEERSYVFAVTPDALQAFELPKRAVVERASRRVYSLMTARNITLKGETEVQKQLRIAQAERQYPQAAATLSRMILGPVAAQLQSKRLLIVSDGALAYIPFSVLPEPRNANAASAFATLTTPTPLMVNHEIVNLPSASVLAVLRQQELGRKPAPKAVAVLADPVFDSHDSRLSSKLGATPLRGISQTRGARAPSLMGDPLLDPPSSIGLLTRSAVDVGLSRNGALSLPRLRFSRREAEEIMAVTPQGEGKEAVDFEASRATATSVELSQYRIVHFATHGLLDSVHPELSGLVFSMVDKNGRPQNGFLELQDIYNLSLPADLVVLSACETGLGKEISGEGLVGLTRGFMYAGASRVMASLWKVSDAGTAALMAEFYRAMEKDSLPPAAALRAAQIKMWQQKRWRNPYYWAAFQLQGEWK